MLFETLGANSSNVNCVNAILAYTDSRKLKKYFVITLSNKHCHKLYLCMFVCYNSMQHFTFIFFNIAINLSK